MVPNSFAPLRVLKKLSSDRKGSTAVAMAVLTPVIVAGLAFGSEAGYWELTQRRLQNAADTAAYSAGTQLRSGADDDVVEEAALLVANQSGFTLSLKDQAGVAGATGWLQVTSPPTTGDYAGDANALHVAMLTRVDRQFSKLFIKDVVTISTEATALVNNGRPACVLSLHPSADGSVEASGSTSVTLDGCDVAANSISSSAILTGGNAASIEADCATTVGGVDDSHGNFTFNDCVGPIENAPYSADPYDDIVAPTCASYSNANNFTRAGNPSRPGSGVAGTVNCYQNVGSLNRDVNLRSNEIYVLHNSDLQLNGGNDITGTNVMIYMSGNSSITINGNATIDISAMTSGTYSGIAIWGDRNEDVDMDLTGNSGVSIVGAIYSPNKDSKVTYRGNTSSFTAGECTQVIGGSVEFTGNSDFDTDCSSSGTREIRTAQSISLVE